VPLALEYGSLLLENVGMSRLVTIDLALGFKSYFPRYLWLIFGREPGTVVGCSDSKQPGLIC